MKKELIPAWALKYSHLFNDLDAVFEAEQKPSKNIVEKKSKNTPPSKPWGHFGNWDYPNEQWVQEPTAADVPEICRQKGQRDAKSKLWSSPESCLNWLVTRATRLGLADPRNSASEVV